MYPRISVEGDAGERGRQYGEQARDRVRRSVEAYDDAFAHIAKWDRAKVREQAARFRAPIAGHGQKYLDEIAGIAEGAGVDELDVLAINVRTEIMFAATARDADARRRLPPECTSFAALGGRTADGRMLVGQNWDWLAHAFDTTVVLEAHQDDGPDYVTVVEAGLLAKTGMNSAGVALVTNALVSDADAGEPGVPYHVLLRSILDAEAVSDALAALQRGVRSSSANYLIAQDGVAIDVEAAPGDFSRLFVGYPQDDLLLHTNHFGNPGFDARDVSLVAMPDSPFRLARIEQLVRARQGPLDRAFWEGALGDHAMFPLGVCCHPDPRATVDAERYATVMALVMDPAARTMWLASGNPCEAAWEQLDLGDVLAKPSAVRPRATA
jgi:isopenicillin-N N-acyltransferase-like protein